MILQKGVFIRSKTQADRGELSTSVRPIPGEFGGFGEIAAALVRQRNRMGYTEIVVGAPFTEPAQLALALQGCRWTKVEIDPRRAAKEQFLAILRNPQNGETCRFGKVSEAAADTSALAQTSATLHTPPLRIHWAAKMAEDDRVLVREGVRYFPLSLAASLAQAPRTTLHEWIRNKVRFNGRLLQTYNSPTMHKLYISEESIERIAHRFVQWPSNKPAGPVVLGETSDQSGYVSLPQAARSIGVDHHTLWLWAAQGKIPASLRGQSLNVIKCPIGDKLYVYEKDVAQLKSHVSRSRVRPSPRHNPAPGS